MDYIISPLVKTLEEIAKGFEDIYRQELEKDIKKAVGEEDWRIMPLRHVNNYKEDIKSYFFALGSKHSPGDDAKVFGKIFPFIREVNLYQLAYSEQKDETIKKIADILQTRGYKIEYKPASHLEKIESSRYPPKSAS